MKKKETKYPIPIREWSEDDRPWEKLLKYGEHTPGNVYPACPVGRDYRDGVESATIPLGICNSNIRFSKKLHQLSVSEAFLCLLCGMTLVVKQENRT
jgi:hypothetical protein